MTQENCPVSLRDLFESRFCEMERQNGEIRQEILRLGEEYRRELSRIWLEREKATQRVRDELENEFRTDVEHIREHLRDQIEHVQLAMNSADRLELERVDNVANGLNCLRAEMTIQGIASEKAILKAEIASEKRFEGMNEFRSSLADQQATFMPRMEAQQRIQSMIDKADSAEISILQRMEATARRLDHMEGRSNGQGSLVAYIIAALATIGTVIAAIYAAVQH